MREFLTSETFYVNSLNRVSGTGSSFSYKFNSGNIDKFDRVVVLDASIPKSFHIINSNNNLLLVNENGAERTVTMPDGNYTRTSFVNVLTTKLNTGGVGWTYAISYPSSSIQDNGKLTYTVTGNSGVQPIFKFPAIEYIYEQMGFDLESENAFAGNTLTSSNVINLAQESTIFLRSDICVSNNSDNILQSFACASNTMYSIFNFVNPDPIFYSKKLSNNTSNSFTFYLTDENAVPIDLNGLTFQFTLCLYKENNIDELIAKYIKYSVAKSRD